MGMRLDFYLRKGDTPPNMANKLLSITVRGNHHKWSFNFYTDPQHIQEWREDGLEIDEIMNTIPVWVADRGWTRAWCFVQDLFHFRNPFNA